MKNFVKILALVVVFCGIGYNNEVFKLSASTTDIENLDSPAENNQNCNNSSNGFFAAFGGCICAGILFAAIGTGLWLGLFKKKDNIDLQDSIESINNKIKQLPNFKTQKDNFEEVVNKIQTVITSLNKFSNTNLPNNNAQIIVNQKAIFDQINDKYEAIKQDIKKLDIYFSQQTAQLDSFNKINSQFDESKANFAQFNEQLLATQQDLSQISQYYKNLIEKNPELVDISITQSLELVKQCNNANFTAEDIKNFNNLKKSCKELNLSSVDDIVECKKKAENFDILKKNTMDKDSKISDLENKIKTITEENVSLKNNLSQLENERKKLSAEWQSFEQEKNTFIAKNNALNDKLTIAHQAINNLKQNLELFSPASVELDGLIEVLPKENQNIKSEVLSSFMQLYWYSEINRDKPRNIKTAFGKFDDTLYELFLDRQDLLQEIRSRIEGFVNENIFKDTTYQIKWPTLGSSASEHEDWYNRENDEGNKISSIRSAVIFNDKSVESVARIYTTV